VGERIPYESEYGTSSQGEQPTSTAQTNQAKSPHVHEPASLRATKAQSAQHKQAMRAAP
jgi:hypothetical protein